MNPKQERTLKILIKTLQEFPHLRICQLISNATGQNDNYNVTDEKLRIALIAFRYSQREKKGG